ncbi:hypothetical protein Gogos_011274, partial [Gossypium gossypioides]|nr:hypothetical protein [Gossypium gossypioides]
MVYNWCLNKDIRPWSLQTTFSDIERKIEQKGNEIASTLAIASIDHGDMFRAW